MKNNRLVAVVLTLFTLLQALATHAQAPPKQVAEVQTKKFLHSGDSLYIEMELTVEAGTIARDQWLTLVPALEADEKVSELPIIVINGKRREKVQKRMVALHKGGEEKEVTYATLRANKKSVLRIDYSHAVPYEAWMDSAKLILITSTCGCEGAEQENSTQLLAQHIEKKEEEGTKKADKPQEADIVAPAPSPFVQYDAYLKFPLGGSTVIPDYLDNARVLDSIRLLVGKLTRDPKVVIKSIEIVGYSSPDGMYIHNKELSEKRAYALRRELQRMYRFKSSLFRVQGVGEDWKGLEDMLQTSEMEERSEVLYIIRTTGIFTGREKKLMDLANGDPYKYMLKNYFPKLRRCSVKINYELKE